jgi:paraquat-inducible protein A
MDNTTNHKFSQRNILALFISLVSFGFLIPGVILSMITVNTRGSVQAPLTNIGIEFLNTSNSIWNTIQQLFYQDYYFVAGMIFIFSVIVPATKGCMLMYVMLTKNQKMRNVMFSFVKALGKWSMCDVFVVAIFLSYLSTGSRSSGSNHETTILGIPIDINILVDMTAKLEIGFYCFLTYCLLSLVALQLYDNK